MPISGVPTEGEPGTRHASIPSTHMSTNMANFWRSYVHIGVLTYSMGALAVLVYAVATPRPAPAARW